MPLVGLDECLLAAHHAHCLKSAHSPLLQAGIVAQGGLLPLLDLLETCQSNLQVRGGLLCQGGRVAVLA